MWGGLHPAAGDWPVARSDIGELTHHSETHGGECGTSQAASGVSRTLVRGYSGDAKWSKRNDGGVNTAGRI